MYQSDFRHIADYLACRGDKEKLQKFRKDETRIVKHPEEFLDMMDAFAGTTTYCNALRRRVLPTQTASELVRTFNAVCSFKAVKKTAIKIY
jgi:hypothetical protein